MRNFDYNIGTCLQFPLNDFFEKIKKENDPNKNIDDSLYKYLEKSNEFLDKAKNYMNDMIYHIKHRKTMNIKFNVFLSNTFLNMYEVKPTFSSNLVLKFGTTIDDMLKIYFKLYIKTYDYEKEINFSWNMFKLNFGDKTPIEIFFNNTLNPTVNVYIIISGFLYNNFNNYDKLSIKELDDTLLIIYFNYLFNEKIIDIGMINENNDIKIKIDNDILNQCLKKRKGFYESLYNVINDRKYHIGPGPKINVRFSTAYGSIINMVFNLDTTIEKMQQIYLRKFFREYKINNVEKELCFTWNATRLGLEDKTLLVKYFIQDSPVVHIEELPSLEPNSRIYKEEVNLIDYYIYKKFYLQ